MSGPVLLEQINLFGEVENDTDGFITAQGRRLHVEQWSLATGIDAQTIRSRLRSGWTADDAVSRAYQPTNRRQSAAFEVPWGAPGSFTWDCVPYSDDLWCQSFIKAHPGGATVEACCATYGLEDSQFRATEAEALMKLRGLILDGDEDARSWFVDAFDEDALDALLERYGAVAPDMCDSGDGGEACDRDDGELFREAA